MSEAIRDGALALPFLSLTIAYRRSPIPFVLNLTANRQPLTASSDSYPRRARDQQRNDDDEYFAYERAAAA